MLTPDDPSREAYWVANRSRRRACTRGSGRLQIDVFQLGIRFRGPLVLGASMRPGNRNYVFRVFHEKKLPMASPILDTSIMRPGFESFFS